MSTWTAKGTWRQRETLPDLVRELEHELEIGPLGARLLVGRGIADPDGARRFLDKRLADLGHPHRIRDLRRAAARLARAIDRRERILVHGDYDVDGCTAAALVDRFCRTCSHAAEIWIPDRRQDGYGLGPGSLEAARTARAQLVVTVDCGICDDGWCARIGEELGCDVIVTDHHLPGRELPRCYATCAPNRSDEPSPDQDLAGVGLAWKLCWATAVELCGSERVSERLRAFLLDALALVALGTIADCVPLVAENRILVHHGLERLAATGWPGLQALLAHCRLDGRVTADQVGWRIAPLLNAAGRLGDATPNITLLTTDDRDEAARCLAGIARDNDERRRLTRLVTDDLIHEVEANPDRYRDRAGLVFAGDCWHPGVVGIVAARLVERFGKPAAVVAIDGGVGKGSLRSVPSVHLGRVIEACREHLLGGGGHALAAGIAVAEADIPVFIEAFDKAIKQRHPGGLPPPGIAHDGDAAIGDLDGDLFRTLERLAPFGKDNPEPTFCLRRSFFVGRPELFGRNGNHLRGALTDAGGGMRQLLAWNARDLYPDLARPGQRFDLLVQPQVDWYQGQARYRLVLVDGAVA